MEVPVARHWQLIEAGRPITVTTLLRICEVFELPISKLVHGLGTGIYEPVDAESLLRRKRITRSH